jgi:hypothetical protein
MHKNIKHHLLVISLSVLALASAQAKPVATNLAPSAELKYSIDAKQSFLSLSGIATVNWQVDSGKSYQIKSETKVSMLGTIIKNTSSGRIDEHGIAPEKFIEKRLGKDQTTTTFDRQKNSISFSQSDTRYYIKGGEQDRSSATWQLVAQARAAGDEFKVGSEWKMQVAYVRDADPWTFKVIGKESVTTPLGTYEAIHVLRAPPPDAKDQSLDLWLAPALEWYPVRLRFNDADGNFIDQKLESVKK